MVTVSPWESSLLGPAADTQMRGGLVEIEIVIYSWKFATYNYSHITVALYSSMCEVEFVTKRSTTEWFMSSLTKRNTLNLISAVTPFSSPCP